MANDKLIFMFLFIAVYFDMEFVQLYITFQILHLTLAQNGKQVFSILSKIY